MAVVCAGKDKVQRGLLTVRDGPSAEDTVGLAFKGEDSNLYLFAVTQAQTLVFDINTSSRSLLDEMGAAKGSTTQNEAGDLVVARPEAVYFYSVDGRGPCFVFEGVYFPLNIHLALLLTLCAAPSPVCAAI